jgi:hypothetical protein
MTCPLIERLAAAAAGEDPRAAAHAATCTACAGILAEHRELRTLARELPAPALTADQRSELAAEVLARAELPVHRGARIVVYAAVAAAALIAAAVWAGHGRAPKVAAPAPHVGSAEEVVGAGGPPHESAVRVPTPGPADTAADPPPSPPPKLRRAAAAITAQGADFSRDDSGERDTVQLRDGVLAIDARGRAPVAVAVGDTTFTVAEARVELVAASGVIVSAHAFAGSVERTTADTHATIISGELWTPPPGPTTSLAAFRAGWQALHAGRTAAALAAFDLATDPVVAEDAMFWAAIAAQRLDDVPGARRRFEAFLDEFPDSARAASAKRALEQLQP